MAIKVLIIGAQGAIGAQLYSYLEVRGFEVLGTSHHSRTRDRTYFRLGASDPDKLPFDRFEYCVICAGKTGFQYCNENSIITREINIYATFQLIKKLSARGKKSIFLSTNAVFSGVEHAPNEYCATNPSTEYGLQKSELERLVSNDPLCKDHVAIVRSTKCLTRENPLIKGLRGKDERPIIAYENLLFSPITGEFLCEMIVRLITLAPIGIFHLSGNRAITFFDFLSYCILVRGGDPRRILSKSYEDKVGSSSVPPVLSMPRSGAILNFSPQTIECVLRDVATY